MSAIYVHIPFCRKKCSYCDFHFSTTFEVYRARMISAIRQELTERKAELDEEEIQSIYFGGGTPSILNETELNGILETIRGNFTVSKASEITLEANPEDITDENLLNWRQAGINRLSIGLQSFREGDLQWMNRAHSVQDARSAVRRAQEAGFDNITVDLIYGLPDLSLIEWKDHVNEVIKMRVPHVSAYCLTVEPKTSLKHRVKRGELRMPDEELQATQYLALVELLAEAGIEQYEISNFAQPSKESRHNSSYWKGSVYLGVGPSAHSFNGQERRWNVANNRQYMDGVEKGLPYSEKEQLSREDQFNERLLTGLRTREGVDKNALDPAFSGSEEFQEQIRYFVGQAWMNEDAQRYVLTAEGRLRADYIAAELFVVE